MSTGILVNNAYRRAVEWQIFFFLDVHTICFFVSESGSLIPENSFPDSQGRKYGLISTKY